MDFLQRNIFTQLRAQYFGSKEELEPMTTFKKKKIEQLMENLSAIPQGEVEMNNRFLNRRLQKIQHDERHAIDTSIETLHLLNILVKNINAMLASGINLKSIIELGTYLRTKGDKVDFVKLDRWIGKLHIQHMAQLEGSILITFFDFEQDELPFVHHIEHGAYRLTLRSLYYNIQDQRDITFHETHSGFVHPTGGTIRKNLRRSMRYFSYAPIETVSNFMNKFALSLSEIEE